MRRSPRPPLSDHRLARLTAWLQLSLVWLVGFCVTWWRDDDVRRRDLDRAAYAVASLVFFNAQRCIDQRRIRPSNNRHGRLTTATRRALLGSRLRRALQGRDWRARLMAIVTVMRDLDAHATALAHRLRRGLTRLRIIDAMPELAPALLRRDALVACVDSS